MRSHSDSLTWRKVFAAGLLLRPILIVPMAPGGPLGGSNVLPIGLAVVFALGPRVTISRRGRSAVRRGSRAGTP